LLEQLGTNGVATADAGEKEIETGGGPDDDEKEKDPFDEILDAHR
jgi:hypothetical protein